MPNLTYLGDFAEDSTVHLHFVTESNDAATAPSSALEAADVVIYKNGSATQKTTANGVTMTSPFDSIVGLHHVSIDTSNDTGDAGFWVPNADYAAVLNPDETVDSKAIVQVITWSIENRWLGSPIISCYVDGTATISGNRLVIPVDTLPSGIKTGQLRNKTVVFHSSGTGMPYAHGYVAKFTAGVDETPTPRSATEGVIEIPLPADGNNPPTTIPADRDPIRIG